MPAASRRARLFTVQPAMRPKSIAKISTKSPEISLLNPCSDKDNKDNKDTTQIGHMMPVCQSPFTNVCLKYR